MIPHSNYSYRVLALYVSPSEGAETLQNQQPPFPRGQPLSHFLECLKGCPLNMFGV